MATKKKEAKAPTKKEIQVVEKIIMKEPQDGVTEKLTPAQVALIKRTIARDATDDELSMFIQVCATTKLNPFLRQIHYVKRWDSKLGKEVGAIQVGIDGLRSIADRTGAYVGSDEPLFEGEEEKKFKAKSKEGKYIAPKKCKVTVKKVVQGIVGEFTADARWDEFYPGDIQGFMWRKMPHVMLAKCAEAQALRKAFPSQMSGLYVQEELDNMQQAEHEAKRAQQMFEQAKTMIRGINDVDALQDIKKKFSKSKKYTKEQKKELRDIVDIQIKKHESES